MCVCEGSSTHVNLGVAQLQLQLGDAGILRILRYFHFRVLGKNQGLLCWHLKVLGVENNC